MISLLCITIRTVSKNKIDNTEDILNLITGATKKLTGHDENGKPDLLHSLKKVGIEMKQRPTPLRPADLYKANFTASPKNIHK